MFPISPPLAIKFEQVVSLFAVIVTGTNDKTHIASKKRRNAPTALPHLTVE
jgi:hypothetical protein